MEGVIIAVIVGLLSGLLGAVIGPVVTHRLTRRQREEQRTEQRHAELRSMIEERMAQARRHLASVFWLHSEVKHRLMSATDAYVSRVTEDLRKDRPGFVWQPYRVEDDQLKNLANRLNEMDNELCGQIAIVATASPADVDDWLVQLYGPTEELEGVFKKIDLRLDELGW